ncbi:MAG: carboxypeptidase regulatory-like domain-containing protein [Nitrospirae bacterium]|nr:carboxypeptidase regulatory-like domain-containing protein [Nitrospirota bacterium]
MKHNAMKTFDAISIGLVFLGMAGAYGGSVVFAYEEAMVTDGGTLTGKVILDGPVPEPRIFPLALYPFGPYCEKNKAISDGQGNVRISEFSIGSDRGMKDVVVAVLGVKKGRSFKPVITNLVARDCQFLPFVSIVQNHGTFSMNNEDPIVHNAQLYQSEKGNLLLTEPNMPHSIKTFPFKFGKNKKIYQMICGMHEFMQTWGYVVDNPYYALTDGDGKFTIDELPPGEYEVIAWRPHFKPIEQEITVSGHQTVSLSFAFDAGTVIRPNYETQEQFRIQR